VREWLLQNGQTAAARVLDGLYLSGLSAASPFTERQACERLAAYRIGRRSVVAALKTVLADGQPVFPRAGSPLHTTPIPAGAAVSPDKTADNQCRLNGATNRVKTPGRPAAYYVLPAVADLAAALGLHGQGGDSLQPDDLASPSAYRRALHRELVKRRPGQYRRPWLADRLGVSATTCRRYEVELDMQVHRAYTAEPVRWATVNKLPLTAETAPPGAFLEAADGKRYPPLRGIAIRLLEAGMPVALKRQGANLYTFAAAPSVGKPTVAPQAAPLPAHDSHSHLPTPPSSHPSSLTLPSVLSPQSLVLSPQSFFYCSACLKTHIAAAPPDACAGCESTDWQRLPDAIWRDTDRLKRWWQTQWRALHPSAPRRATPLASQPRRRKTDTSAHTSSAEHINARPLEPAAEAAARRAHDAIADLSLNNARRLVARYGGAAVDDACRRVAARQTVTNPAGFLVTLLRSEHLFHSPPEHRSQRPSAESTAEWVTGMTTSPYSQYLANADEFDPGGRSA
jgi:hypothetical protein